jgi:hypothetical protein
MNFDVVFTDIRGLSPCAADTSWKVVVFESTNKMSSENFCHRQQIWIYYEQLSENAILGLTWLESD